MAIAAQVGKRYLCVHGGISPELNKIEEINKVKRTVEVPESGLFCDLLWSDPVEEDEESSKPFSHNESRDCSVYFDKSAVN